jgi:hypothetical protein
MPKYDATKWIDADGGENHQHRDDRDHFPTDVLVHDELPLPSVATGACPW